MLIKILVLLGYSALSAAELHVTSHADGSFDLAVNGKPWLSSSGIKLHADSRWHSTAQRTLRPVGIQRVNTSSDALGRFTAYSNEWVVAGSSAVQLVTTVRDYTPSGLPVAVMEQHFPLGLKDTSLGPTMMSKEQVMSAFPRFSLVTERMGFVAYYDQMVGGMQNGTKTGTWHGQSQAEEIPGGTMAGPVILFNTSGDALVLGYYENFLSGQHRQSHGILEFGVLGSVTAIPKGYTSTMMVYHSEGGINDAVEGYGHALLTRYGKAARQWDTVQDVSIQKLGYYTDKYGDQMLPISNIVVLIQWCVLLLQHTRRERNKTDVRI